MRGNDTELIFSLISEIVYVASTSQSCSRPRLCKLQPSEGLASRLLEMISFTFPDIFKRFSNVQLRTTRGSTSLSRRSWIIARFFTTFSQNGGSKPPREKRPRIFFTVFFHVSSIDRFAEDCSRTDRKMRLFLWMYLCCVFKTVVVCVYMCVCYLFCYIFTRKNSVNRKYFFMHVICLIFGI